MDLNDLRIALRRHWPIALAALVFWMTVGGLMVLFQGENYETAATIAATPKLGENGAVSVQNLSFEIPAIVERLSSGRFIDSVRATLPSATADANVSLHAASVEGTGIIRLVASSRSPSAAADWANAAMRQAVEDQPNPLLTLGVVDDASISNTPTGMKASTILVASFVLGILSALIAAGATLRLRATFDLVDELSQRLDVPVLGALPKSSSVSRRQTIFETALGGDPLYSEALQSILTGFEIALMDTSGQGARRRIVAVTSWSAGEGKSTVTAGLGASIALSGNSVIIIDADLRRPRQHDLLDEPFGEGVADADRLPITSLVRETRLPRLGFVAAGVPDRHPAAVVTSTLNLMTEQLARSNNLLLLDAPPIHGLAETPLILAACERVILVVDGSAAKVPDIERAVRHLRRGGFEIAGLVVNRVSRRRLKSSYTGYKPAPLVREGSDAFDDRWAVRTHPRRPAPTPAAPSASTDPSTSRASSPGPRRSGEGRP